MHSLLPQVKKREFHKKQSTLDSSVITLFIDVEYIYGFVGWGGLQAKSMTSYRAEPSKMAGMRYHGNVMTTTRWRLYVTMETL